MPELSQRMAHTVLGENLKVRKGESVLIETWTHGIPYARALAAEARRLGAHPTVLYEDEEAWWDAVNRRDFAALSKMSDAEKAALASTDVYVYLWGPEDRPRRDKLPQKTQDRVTEWNEGWYDIARKNGVRGVRLTVAQATDPVASEFGFDGPKWRERILEAATIPAAAMRAKGARLAKAFTSGTEAHFTHPNGSDLTFRLKNVTARVDVGEIDAAARKRRYGMMGSSPTGQIFLKIENSAPEGTIVGNRALYLGPTKFDATTFTFRNGKLAEHSLGNGAKQFEEGYAKGGKARDLMGYMSVGLNPRGKDLAPVEDTEEGAILYGIGTNMIVDGKQKSPFFGCVMVGGGTLAIDGKTVVANGKVR